MGGSPVIVWLRPGVGYEPAAAASMRRLERTLGREHDCNSSYRDYGSQMRMFLAWERYVESGYDPRLRPDHSRAVHPDNSDHCKGIGDDSDDWTTPGYIALAAEHGWIRTAASDPTERHHFTYQWWKDQHRNDPDPEEDDMYDDKAREELNQKLDDIRDGLGLGNARGSGGDVSVSANLQKVARVLWAGGPDVDAQLGATNSVFGLVIAQHAQLAALTAALANVQAGNVDLAAVARAAEDGARRALDGLTLTASA